MSTYDPDRDADMTADWPANQPAPAPSDDGGGPTAAVPQYNPAAPPPASPIPQQYGHGQPAVPGWPLQSGPAAPPGGGWQPPQPPGQYPIPGYPAGAPTPPSKKRPWGLIAAALIGVVVLVGAGVFVFGGNATFGSDPKTDNPTPTSQAAGPSQVPETTGGPSPTPSPSQAPAGTAGGNVDPAALPSLLESIPSLNEKYQANLIPAADLATTPFTGLTVQPGRCTSAILPGMKYTYMYADYTGFSGQVLTDDATHTKLMQAVIAFNTEAEATRFFNAQLIDGWKECADIKVTAEGGGTHATIQTGAISEAEGVTSLSMRPAEDSVGSDMTLHCERSVAPRENVIVDVRVCVNKEVSTLGQALVNSISAKIAAAP